MQTTRCPILSKFIFIIHGNSLKLETIFYNLVGFFPQFENFEVLKDFFIFFEIKIIKLATSEVVTLKMLHPSMIISI